MEDPEEETEGCSAAAEGGTETKHFPVIKCLYCSAEVYFNGIPAHRYEAHLGTTITRSNIVYIITVLL